MKGACVSISSPSLFLPLAISSTALQEEKLVGICALPLPSLGTINMQGLLPGQGPFPLFLKVTLELWAAEDGPGAEQGCLGRMCCPGRGGG